MMSNPNREILDDEHPRNWPEDFGHDNGNYLRTCHVCKLLFRGDKRRVICKLCRGSEGETCANGQPANPTPDQMLAHALTYVVNDSARRIIDEAIIAAARQSTELRATNASLQGELDRMRLEVGRAQHDAKVAERQRDMWQRGSETISGQLDEFQRLAQQVRENWDCGGDAWWAALEKIRAVATLAPAAPAAEAK